MKKLWILLLAMVLIFSFAACGSSGDDGADDGGQDAVQGDTQTLVDADTPDDEQQEEQTPPEELSGWLKTKTGKFYSQFKDGKMVMEYETSFDGMTMKTTTATSGDKSYTSTEMNGTSTGSSIMIGNKMYTIDHESKMILEMTVEGTGQELAETFVEEEDLDLDDIKSGTRDIDGKAYETETWVLEGTETTYCFDGDQLAYIIGVYEDEEMTMKILKMSSDVDESLFELPEGYQTMSF